MENEIIQVDFDATDGHVICSWEAFEIVEAVAAEDNILHIALYVLAQVLLFANGAAHHAPRLAGAGLIWVKLATTLGRFRTEHVILLEAHIEAEFDRFLGHFILFRDVNILRWRIHFVFHW